MRYIVNHSKNPYINLALEEYCLKNVLLDEDYFILWQNKPSIIIGKNQNTLQEINSTFVDQRKTYVVRRISGGGAVYHDLGNLNFTFISKVQDIDQVDFKKYVAPIIKVLQEMGIPAELSGRNDITVEGKKVSGNAQRIHQDRLMHHGTLMFDVNLEDLAGSLRVSVDKIQSKGIESVRSRVANIKDYLQEEMNVIEFYHRIERALSNNYQSEEMKLTRDDMEKIQALAMNQYATWDWNYGESPACNVMNERRFPGGKIQVLLDVMEGKIKNCRFLGDYLGVADVEPLEAYLQGKPYQKELLREALGKVPIKQYFGGINKEELLEVLCG
ncbi:lipoate--protein ligase [Alkaliphilus crotonatoxidans]